MFRLITVFIIWMVITGCSAFGSDSSIGLIGGITPDKVAELIKTPEVKQAMVDVMSSPEMREQMVALLSSPEMKQVVLEAMRTPEMQETMKTVMKSPEMQKIFFETIKSIDIRDIIQGLRKASSEAPSNKMYPSLEEAFNADREVNSRKFILSYAVRK